MPELPEVENMVLNLKIQEKVKIINTYFGLI